jgi:hypothetical protein
VAFAIGVADGPKTIPEDVVMFPPLGALVADTLPELAIDVLNELPWEVGTVETLPEEISLDWAAELGMVELGKELMELGTAEFVEVAGGGLKLPSCRLIGILFAASTVWLLFARKTRKTAESCHGALILPALRYSNSDQKIQQVSSTMWLQSAVNFSSRGRRMTECIEQGRSINEQKY